MKLDELKAGRYVVAVSGGIDSVVLMDLLSKKSNLDIIIAHLDHGIRSISKKDRLFVQSLAKKKGLAFEYGEAKLGAMASEATARKVRYEFLESVKRKYNAQAIVTAHHQDDVLETAIINMIRGTGRRGVSALKSNPDLLRPMLPTSKQDIIRYAESHGLVWHEDLTNRDTTYLRNFVRHNLLTKLKQQERHQLLSLINQTSEFNQRIDQLLSSQLEDFSKKGQLNRQWFIMLPHSVSKEVIATWLRQHGMLAFDRKTIERLVVAAKTGRSGSRINIYGKASLLIQKDYLALDTPDR